MSYKRHFYTFKVFAKVSIFFKIMIKKIMIFRKGNPAFYPLHKVKREWLQPRAGDR